MAPRDPSPRLPWWAIALDGLAAVGLLLGAWVLLSGGLRPTDVLGIRVSVSHPARAVLAGLLLLALRHWLAPHHPVLSRIGRTLFNTGDLAEHRLFGAFSVHPARELLAVSVGFAALVAVVTWPQVRDLYSVPDFGDPLFSVWRLSWVAHQLPIDIRHLFDGNIFHPEKLTLTYSDSLIFPALLAAPFFWLGLPHLPIYTVLFLSAFAASGVSVYYLVRALTGRRDAAAVSGVIFAIYPYRFEHYSHLELQMTMAAPLALWCLHRALASGRLRDGLLTGVMFALQMLSSLYYGVFLSVYMVVVGATMWLARQRPIKPLLPLAAGALVAGAMILPVATQYIANKPMFGERPVEEIHVYSARPVDFLIPHFRSAMYGQWDEGGQPERQLFPGVVAVALALVGLWAPLGGARLAYLLGLVLAFDGALGLNGLIYPLLHDYIGPFRGLRSPARFSILFGLSLSVLAGYGVARIAERWRSARSVVVALILALVVTDLWPRLHLLPVWQEPPAVYAAIPTSPKAVLAEFPIGNDDRGVQYDFRYEYFSTWHFHKLLNGNSGFFPPSWDEFFAHGKDFPSDDTLTYLRSRGVQYLVVHGGFYEDPETFSKIQTTLLHRADLERVTAARFAGGLSELYRFR